MGDTKVICSASVEQRSLPFCEIPQRLDHRRILDASPLNAYAHLSRILTGREMAGFLRSRAHWALFKVCDRSLWLWRKDIWIDCDVIQADGGTRTASITGAYVALVMPSRRW